MNEEKKEFKPKFPELLRGFNEDVDKYRDYLVTFAPYVLRRSEDEYWEMIEEVARCRIYLEGHTSTYACSGCPKGCTLIDEGGLDDCPSYCPFDSEECKWAVQEERKEEDAK